jgi:hypothetical protein
MPNGGPNGRFRSVDMSQHTNTEGFAYIERQFKECNRRIELQRRIVEQLHAIDADATQAEASLNALMDDQASKLRIMAYLEKWGGKDSN